MATGADRRHDSAPRRGKDRPGACALAWDDAPQAAWGTASHARFWVGLEQSGPWGRDAFAQSRLDPELGRALERACARAGGRALLMRIIGPEQEPAGDAAGPGRPRRVFVAGGMPQGRPWLLAGHVVDPADVLDIPWSAAEEGDAAAVLTAVPWLREHRVPVALVCTNSKRDVCCAVRGRPAAREAATMRPGRVWECSHTGGHRFAPTGVLLPHGTTFARADGEAIVAALDAAEHDRLVPLLVDPARLRGLSHLWPAAQAADAHVRRTQSVLGLTDLRVEQLTTHPLDPALVVRPDDGTDPSWEFAVTHADGRSWRVGVTDRVDGQVRVTSCGAQPVLVHDFDTRTLPAG